MHSNGSMKSGETAD